MMFLSVWAFAYTECLQGSFGLYDENIEGYFKHLVANTNSNSKWDTYFICTFLSFVLVRVCWKPCDSCCRHVPKDFPKGLQKRTVDSRPFHCVILHWPSNVNWGKMCFVVLLQKKGNGFLFIIITDKMQEHLP